MKTIDLGILVLKQLFFKSRKLSNYTLWTKDFGGPGLSTIGVGAINFEMAKIDGSVAMSFLVHNCLGIAVVDALGDDE